MIFFIYVWVKLNLHLAGFHLRRIKEFSLCSFIRIFYKDVFWKKIFKGRNIFLSIGKKNPKKSSLENIFLNCLGRK